MDKLTTLKNSDKLRNCMATNGLISVTRNATRWTSDHRMLIRFIFLYPHLFSLNLARDTTILIPTPDGFEKCQELLKILTHFYDATISLQKESIDMHDIRCILDVLKRCSSISPARNASSTRSTSKERTSVIDVHLPDS